MLKAANRVANANDRDPTIGSISDARPSSLSVKLAGFNTPVPCTASDLFDLFPLESGDVVLCLPIVGGWHIIDRLTGAEPEIRLGVDEIDGSMVQAGPPFSDDDEAVTKVQAYRSPAVVDFDASAVTVVTWTFTEPFAEVPFVIPTLQGTGDLIFDLSPVVRTVTEEVCTLAVRNAAAAVRSARLVAFATGVV